LLPDSATDGVSNLLAWTCENAYCHIMQCDPRGALLWKLAENVTASKTVFTYDYIVLGLMRYFSLILDRVQKERGNREWRTLHKHGLPDVSSLYSFSTANT
jgi:hypothetical protein